MESSIAELLYEHDCVIVPDFGGFVANYKSAHIHPRLHVISPPSKSISFNRKLLRNDGLIANYIAEKEGISYTAALIYIEKTVREYKAVLEAGKRLEIEEVGSLYFDTQKNLQFIPNQDTNFLSSSFGLQNVSLPEIAVEQEESIITPVVPINREEKSKNPWWVGVAAVALPIALVSVFMFQDVFKSNQQYDFAGLNPFSSVKKTASYQPEQARESFEIISEKSSESLENAIAESNDAELITFNFEEDKVAEEGISIRLKEEEIASVPEISNSSLGLYFVIAGAFEMQENATGLVKDLRAQGFDAAEIGMRGRLHLVAYGAHNTRSSAKNALQSIQDNQLSGWIYKK